MAKKIWEEKLDLADLLALIVMLLLGLALITLIYGGLIEDPKDTRVIQDRFMIEHGIKGYCLNTYHKTMFVNGTDKYDRYIGEIYGVEYTCKSIEIFNGGEHRIEATYITTDKGILNRPVIIYKIQREVNQ